MLCGGTPSGGLDDLRLHQYDWGTSFTLTTLFDGQPVFMGDSSTVNLTFQKPDGTLVTDDAILYSGGIDGRVYYTIGSGFLDQIGVWQVQSFTQSTSGTWYSDIYKFRVHRNVE